jgi:hypothetical protein
VDTEGDAASDDLDTINGGAQVGQRLLLRAINSARTVVVKNATGNIQCGADISLTHTYDIVELVWGGSNWFCVSEHDNAA